jgi:predicted 3-demethylubiquinone-9 3-methyltransferase (glyoxalase superfamily)
MGNIITHLWFDKKAIEAAEFYVSIFGEASKIGHITRLNDTPSGLVEIVTFELLGRNFQAISAGPFFNFNPSVSFQVLCPTHQEVDALWNQLLPGGMALMEIGAYPFSERFGWVQDKYGLSWQLFYSGAPATHMKIKPVIMFVGAVCGKAEEAINFWLSVFGQGQIQAIQRYGKNEGPDAEGTVKQATFTLLDQEFGAMDSAYEHSFSFDEAISFIVPCRTQDEIDRYWSQLSAVPEAEQCGWLKDRYGFSWQIVPTAMDEMMSQGSQEQIARVTQAFLPMKKFDIATLWRAYQGEE